MVTISAPPPSITIIGCGGHGIEVVDRLQPDVECHGNVKIHRFDCSSSNVNTAKNVRIFGSGHGSGNDRTTNARAVRSEMAGFDVTPLKDDVMVCVYNAGGASGSVIAPYFIEQCIAVGVVPISFIMVDTVSQRSAKNNIDTLSMLAAIAKQYSVYLPIVVINNSMTSSVMESRNIGDSTVNHLLRVFVDIESIPAKNIDRRDRINWINPKFASKDLTSGLKLVNLLHADDKQSLDAVVFPDIDDQDIIFDSVFSIGTKAGNSTVHPLNGRLFDRQLRFIADGVAEPPLQGGMGICTSDVQVLDVLIGRMRAKSDAIDRSVTRSTLSVTLSDGDDPFITS